MHLRQNRARQETHFLVYLDLDPMQGTCLVAANVILSIFLLGCYQRPRNLLAGFERPFRGWEKDRKGQRRELTSPGINFCLWR